MKFVADYDLSIIDFNNRIKRGAEAFNGPIQGVLPQKTKSDNSFLLGLGALALVGYGIYLGYKKLKQLNTDKKLANAVISDSNKQPEQ